MEPLTVVGGVAACSQLARYGCRIIRYMSDLPSDLQSIPNTVRDLVAYVDWHLAVVQSLSLDPTTSSAHSIINKSICSALSLRKLLDTLVIQESDTKTVKLRKVVIYQRRARKIARFRADLESCERNLTLHFSTLQYHVSTSQVKTRRSSLNTSTTCSPDMPAGILFNSPPRKDFTGRRLLLDLVTQALTNPTLGKKACLVGLGGIGKSQTAVECAHRLHDLDPSISVIWIQATTQASFQQSLQELASIIQLRIDGDSAEMTFRKVVDWLDSKDSGSWILVIDDIDLATFGDAQIVDALPLKANCASLFTTRSKHTAAFLTHPHCAFLVEPMAADEAHELLTSHLEAGAGTNQNLGSLLMHLDYIPLAILKATEYMRATSMSPATYLHHFEASDDNRAALLAWTSPMSINPSMVEKELSLTSLKVVQQQSQTAAELLCTMSCIGPVGIPRTLFEGEESSLGLTQDLGLLKSYSLIASSDRDDAFNMPSLVRLSVQSQLKKSQQLQRFQWNLVQLFLQRFPNTREQYGKIHHCRLYLPHALAMLGDFVVEMKLSSEQSRFVAALALRLSLALRILGRYEEAAQFAAQALVLVPRSSNPYKVDIPTLICLGNVATVDLYLGHIKICTSRIDGVLYTQTFLLSAHHPLAIRFLRQKGLATQAQGLYAEAEPFHRKAVAIAESLYEAEDPRTLDEKHGLALSVLRQGRAQEALSSLQDIYEIMEDTLGISNPKTLSVLSNIGGAFQVQSRWDEAHRAIERALSGREDILGADHPHTLNDRANLAQIYVAKGDMRGAEHLTRETLRLHEAKLGTNHLVSLHILNNLGYLLLDQNRFDDAAETLHRVSRKRERVLGLEHCDTLASMFFACEAYWKQARYEEALIVGQKVLLARQSSLPEGHIQRRNIEERMMTIEQEYTAQLSL